MREKSWLRRRSVARQMAVPHLGSVLAWLFVLLLGGLGLLWHVLLREYPGWWQGLSSLGLAFLLAFTLILALRVFHWPKTRRYRLGFLFGAAWPVILCGWYGRESGHLGLAVGLAGMAVLGAWLGALLLTGLQMGWWEDNFPPAPEVQQAVLSLHRQLIGAPDPLPAAKRGFDLLLAGGGLLLSLPVWLLSMFLIWWEDPGPLFFVKNSVGRGGVNIHQYKFRTMVCGAEETTGPVLAQEADSRVLRCGRLLRKTALDELPQLINILRGEMSFVGPRPQRTVLVYTYLQELPEYAERHRVLPGLAGLAQVAGDYYLTPLQKLRFDRLYIQHASLRFDLWLLILAFLVAFWFRWQKGWSGRLSPRWIRGCWR